LSTLRSQLDALASNFALRFRLLPFRNSAPPKEDGAAAVVGRTSSRGWQSVRPDVDSRRGEEAGQEWPLSATFGGGDSVVREKVLLLVKTHKRGTQAEEIRAALSMGAKETPASLTVTGSRFA
jgi:hypothetical protein